MRLEHLIAVAMLLPGCGNAPANRDDLNRERSERIDNHVRLQSRVEDMDARIRELERELEFTKKQVARTGAATTARRDVSDLALKAQLKQMSADGVCGQEPPARLPNGGVIIRNRECTEADLQ